MTTTGFATPTDRVLVLFGATGDLAGRKLLPGLFHLYRVGLMPDRFRIIGSGRHAPDDFAGARRTGAADPRTDGARRPLGGVLQRLSFVASTAEDGSDLAAAVTAAEREIDAKGERLVYLSVPPNAMADMVGDAGEDRDRRQLLAGRREAVRSRRRRAKQLNADLHEVLDEESIYRIDHFLGKEAAQNILALRFANGIFEPVWNRDHIAYVQIDVPEQLDIQGRADFYEGTGAFRDMVVTHLMQILGIVALEPPSRIDGESLQLERTKVFDGVRPLDPERVVFGQYDGYRETDGVADDSQVETFVALEVFVDTWRWSGVPFYLRTGKAMAEGRRTVTIGFTEAPLRIFPDQDPDAAARPSELVFELSDDPQVRIEVRAKIPGPTFELGRAALTLDVDEAFDGVSGLEAYERLLHDVMLRERLLFTRAEQIERIWEVCTPVIDAPPAVEPYEPGSWGPEAALRLPGPRGWRLPDGD